MHIIPSEQSKLAFLKRLYNNFLMWWKIYSWIAICLLGLGLFIYVWYLPQWTVYDWVSFISSAIIIFVLYSFLYNPKAVSQQIWKIIFWVSVVSTVAFFGIYLSTLKASWLASALPSTNEITLNEYIFFTILGLPILFANYQLAYKKISKKA